MYPFNFFIFAHFLYIVYLTVPTSATNIVSYNESCNRENRCDSEAALFCNDKNKCACIMNHTRVYDNTRAKCLFLAGKSCVDHQSLTSKILDDCVSHAHCVNEICKCNPGFYEHLNGTCEEQQLGKVCTSNEMCSQPHSVCGSEGTCGCDNTTSLYDSTRKTCVVKAGSICSRSYYGDDCIENAYCNSNYTCVCASDYYSNADYFKNAEGICERKRKLGELCNDDTNCKSDITLDLANKWKAIILCNNGTCGCNNEIAVQAENISSGVRICRVRLGKRCYSYSYNDKCVDGSECTSAKSSFPRCKCMSTHYETESETCAAKKEYGERCTLDKECNERPGYLICHPSENICTCRNGTIKHPDLPGWCAVSVEQTVKYCNTDDYIDTCVPNAECSSTNCKCVNNTVASPNQNGYCFIRDGDSCYGDIRSPITNRTCLPGLFCQNGTCSCLYGNHQEYVEKEEKCITLINGPCNESFECTHNSECIDDDGLKVCRCKKGFTGVHRKCDLAHGESCVQGQSYPKCDRLVPLQCSVNRKCECLPLQVYDNKELKCRGLAGAECELDKDNFCVEGAECKWFRSLGDKWGICRCLAGLNVQEDGKCGSGI